MKMCREECFETGRPDGFFILSLILYHIHFFRLDDFFFYFLFLIMSSLQFFFSRIHLKTHISPPGFCLVFFFFLFLSLTTVTVWIASNSWLTWVGTVWAQQLLLRLWEWHHSDVGVCLGEAIFYLVACTCDALEIKAFSVVDPVSLSKYKSNEW